MGAPAAEGYFLLVDIAGSVRKFDDRGETKDPFVPGDWFQLAKSGTFYSEVYGKVTISTKDLETMYRNFKEVTPLPPTQLPIDYDHLSDDPQQPGQARAAGWVENLELREGSTELWCLPKWTRSAARMIQDGEYRFVSPYFLTDYKDKASGKKVGPTLKAVAVTNRPFLEGMQEIPAPAIAASDKAVLQFGKDKRVAVPLRQTANEKKPARRSIKMADEQKDAPPALKCPNCGAAVSHDGSHMKPKVVEGEDAPATDVTDLDKGTEAPKEMDEGGVADDRSGDPDYQSKDSDDVKDLDLKEEEMCSTKMSEQDKAKLSKTERMLLSELEGLRAAHEDTSKALKTMQDTRRRELSEKLLAEGQRTGKLTKRMVGDDKNPGWAMKEAFRNPNRFSEWLREAPKVVDFQERGSSDETAANGAATTSAKIEQLVAVKMSENPKLIYADATKAVLSENRALAEKYDTEMIGERGASMPRGVRRL